MTNRENGTRVHAHFHVHPDWPDSHTDDHEHLHGPGRDHHDPSQHPDSFYTTDAPERTGRYDELFLGTTLEPFYTTRRRDPDPIIDSLLDEQAFWTVRVTACERIKDESPKGTKTRREANRLYLESVNLANIAGLMVARAVQARDLAATQ